MNAGISLSEIRNLYLEKCGNSVNANHFIKFIVQPDQGDIISIAAKGMPRRKFLKLTEGHIFELQGEYVLNEGAQYMIKVLNDLIRSDRDQKFIFEDLQEMAVAFLNDAFFHLVKFNYQTVF